ncbi:tetratricopeptide repeat protein [Candidatus Woesearchaeota archaeon]|nr:tetratricopeptide repeat protein [Candidatus Woesearchaeota archaeon]
MKKIITILLILLLLLSACKAKEEQKKLSVEEINKLLLEAKYLIDQGQYSPAIAQLNKVIEADQNNVDAHFLLSLSYIFLGDAEKSKKELDIVLLLDPTNPNAMEFKKIIEGQASLNPVSKNEEAMKHLKKAEEYFTQKKLNEAIEEYKKAIKEDPEFSTAYLYLGDAYYVLKNYDEAIIWFSKAIEKDPKNKRSYHYLGDAYLAKNEKAKAIENYEKALEIDPNYTIVQSKLEDL